MTKNINGKEYTDVTEYLYKITTEISDLLSLLKPGQCFTYYNKIVYNQGTNISVCYANDPAMSWNI